MAAPRRRVKSRFLQQISLDVSRLKSAGEPLPRISLRDRARELSAYVDDLQAGHRQLARDGLRHRAPTGNQNLMVRGGA